MDESIQGIVILVIITTISAVAWHSFVKNTLIATLFATASTVVGFQIINYVHIGYLDPFFIVAMITSGIGAFFISFFIGILFTIIRAKISTKSKKET